MPSFTMWNGECVFFSYNITSYLVLYRTDSGDLGVYVKVLPGLYIGNLRASRDEQLLKDNNITHIISIHHSELKPLKRKKYLSIIALDVAWQDLNQFFEKCITFIHRNRLQGSGVLVHCLVGRSRSVTIVAAYIMTVTSMGWRDAITIIKEARSCANPNFAFQLQLQKYEYEQLKEKRKQLREQFPSSPFSDEEDCKQILYSFKKRTRSHSYHSLSTAAEQTDQTDSGEEKMYRSCVAIASANYDEDHIDYENVQTFESLSINSNVSDDACSSETSTLL